ncbi:MAG: hypothetical protein KAX57_04240 [Rhodoferax sp.]|jgi:hypothetical protein|nr:hypothetical protein [Rhodoferax sp.]MBP8286031.1 hypothetical protein [Rhodoferax sp.]MBP9147874.1 hypothetical protein [Rhodoferax sp.]MBP9736700.1 hypothetical protein [Rhodoferax sp.]
MTLPEASKPEFDPQEWEKRKATNARLGWVVGVIVLLMFFGALWKYRPL